MRFIIREQDYEQLVAAGKFRYGPKGQMAEITESWRMTSIADDYFFLRVDYDERETSSGESTLFHLALAPNRVPERLKFRHFEPGQEIIGDVQIGSREITLSRSVNGHKFEDEESMTSGHRFWFPSAIGLALLVSSKRVINDRANNNLSSKPILTATLNKKNAFELVSQTAQINYEAKEEIAVSNTDVAVQRYSIEIGDQKSTLWIDDHLLPIQLHQGDDLMATETQYIRYR